MNRILLLCAASLGAVDGSVAIVRPIRRASNLRMAEVGRRELALGVAALPFVLLGTGTAQPAQAAAGRSVFVAGATGKTGRLVCRLLCERGGANVLAGVRSEAKALDLGLLCAQLKQFDVTGTTEQIAASLAGADSVVCTLGFVPGNPLKMGEAAHAVDNVGTCKLIAASKLANVKQFVLVSSILTNGRAWGQASSPGFVITNAFGGVLDEKLVAEQFLRDSGLSYTIVRPGGLRDEVGGDVTISKQDTLNSGEVARASVAQVCVEALFSASAKNKVVEVVETDAGTPREQWFA